jgi:hypothetical protein
MHEQVSDRKVAANQSNARKSTGPKTVTGKARASLNSFKHGAYAKLETRHREIMLRGGEDPRQYEQLQQDFEDSWEPDDATQAMLVKTLVDLTWEKVQLRGASLAKQLATRQLAEAQAERRQLAARRWLAGGGELGVLRGLHGAKDSPEKFRQILEHLDRLQEWFQNEDCPDEFPDVMASLYGEFPTVAGQQIKTLFIQLFDDNEAVREKARQELPKWIAQERSHAQQDRELYRRELEATRDTRGPSVPDEQVAARQAALNRQIAEQIRLLLQLKSKRYLWRSEPEGAEPAASGDLTTENLQSSDRERSADRGFRSKASDSQETITKGDVVDSAEETIGGEMAQKERTNEPTK